MYKYVLLVHKNFIVVQATQKAINRKTHVDKERNYYRSTEKFSLPLTRPIAVLNIVAHYNFDYAQQV